MFIYGPHTSRAGPCAVRLPPRPVNLTQANTKRKGVHDFTRFLLKYDFESKPLPPEKGWGKVVAMVAAAASALILSAAYLLPLAWYTVYRYMLIHI